MKVVELQESTDLDTHSMAEQIFAFAEEHAMDADRNMKMGETNFKDPDRF